MVSRYCEQDGQIVEYATEPEKMKIRIIMQLKIKEAFLQFLLELNEDFDDDLLLDAIGLLDV